MIMNLISVKHENKSKAQYVKVKVLLTLKWEHIVRVNFTMSAKQKCNNFNKKDPIQNLLAPHKTYIIQKLLQISIMCTQKRMVTTEGINSCALVWKTCQVLVIWGVNLFVFFLFRIGVV